MVACSAYATSQIELGLHGLACLAHLPRVLDPARINRCARRRDSGVEPSRDLPQTLEAGLAPQPATAGDDALSVPNIDRAGIPRQLSPLDNRFRIWLDGDGFHD